MGWFIIILLLLLVIAVIYDIRFARIPNWLTYPSMVVGIILQTAIGGTEGLFSGLAGIGVGMGLFMLPYLMTQMGAGDVKLMGAIGAFIGPKACFIAVLYTALVGGLYAIILLAVDGFLFDIFKRYALMLKTYLLTKAFIYIPPPAQKMKSKLRYAIAIATGTTISLVLNFSLEYTK